MSKTVKLIHDRGWWYIINEKGKEISNRVNFGSEKDAHDWAKNWISSWPNVELIIDEPTKS